MIVFLHLQTGLLLQTLLVLSGPGNWWQNTGAHALRFNVSSFLAIEVHRISQNRLIALNRSLWTRLFR